jgi:hypothetical protein
MSAGGQDRTYAPPQMASIFDRIVGACDELQRYSVAEHLGACQVDDDELGGEKPPWLILPVRPPLQGSHPRL